MTNASPMYLKTSILPPYGIGTLNIIWNTRMIMKVATLR